jgi:hypothetical protein
MVPYNVNLPYQSVSKMMIDNPVAAFMRNIHYWSAQFFFVLSIIHLFDHFLKRSESGVGRGVWLRLVISVAALFFAMLSGFMLKGDMEAEQARSILSSLLKSLPFAGDVFEYSILGEEGSYQLTYVHHIATATIFLFIVIFEHARAVWPAAFGLIVTLFITLLISFFFSAPLHNGFDTVIKGPWYFTGFQELLHWMSDPAWSWLVIFLVLLVLYLVREPWIRPEGLMKGVFIFLTGLYGLLTIIGIGFRGENWQWEPFWKSTGASPAIHFAPLSTNLPESYLAENAKLPVIMGRYEGCLVCHDEMDGFSPSHDPSAIGCVSCHQGNPFTLNKNTAHRDMVNIPGNLVQAEAGCGAAQCHGDIVPRVQNSIMTTNSGIVSVNRWVFGESESLSVLSHISEIGHSAADRHLRDMCAHCHLGMVKTSYGKIDQLTRGGGCSACHLQYDISSLKEISHASEWGDDRLPIHHPALTIEAGNGHCFGCHSRSGRISLNYEGWHETMLDEEDVADRDKFRVLQDKRVFRFIREDVHHKAGMQCIDCHTSYGVMGDGHLYLHKEEQVKIECTDCHTHTTPVRISFNELDVESMKIARLRGLDTLQPNFLVHGAGGNGIVNLFNVDEKRYLSLKSGKAELECLPPASVCQAGDAHADISCSGCHAAWVPQCIGCHNEFDPAMKGYDLLERKEKEGSWVEFVGKYLADPPALGVSEREGEREVMPFAPGMVLSIDLATFEMGKGGQEEIFKRLYSPVSPHTIAPEGRTCVSCHLDPLALGYGRGRLDYSIRNGAGYFEFTPRFENSRFDGLPEDAWIGFLAERGDQAATRLWARPFNIREQRDILTVGACLTCHEEGSDIMEASLKEYQWQLQNLSPSCILPRW